MAPRTAIMDVTQVLTSLLSVVSVITVAWFGYNQKAHERRTEATIAREKEEFDKKRKSDILEAERDSSRRRRHSAVIYGELGELRSDYDACRVYIAQPHPMGEIEKISIYYEVKRKGVEDMRKHIQQLPLSDIPIFSKELADTPFIHYKNVDDVRDDVAHSMMHIAGTKTLFAVRLLDANDDWCGTLFLEYTRKHKYDAERIMNSMTEVAKSIHLILPEYKE